MDDIQDFRNQDTCVERDRFSWFQVYLNIRVSFAEAFNNLYQPWDVVIFSCDMMTAAEVHPFHLWYEF